MIKRWTWVNEYDEDATVVAEKAFKTAEEAMADAADDIYYALQDVDQPEWNLETAEWTWHITRDDEFRTTRVKEIAATISVYAIEIEVD